MSSPRAISPSVEQGSLVEDDNPYFTRSMYVLHTFLLFRKCDKSKVKVSSHFVLCRQLKLLSVKIDLRKSLKKKTKEKINCKMMSKMQYVFEKKSKMVLWGTAFWGCSSKG